MQVESFVFNPFQENTYVLYDDTKECVIIDPGCHSDVEKVELKNFIEKNRLQPVKLINTHCHLDHVFGNKYIFDTFGLLPEFHRGELPVLQAAPQVSMMYGVSCETSPMPKDFIEDNVLISFGESSLLSIFAPGHSPASLCFYSQKDGFLIGGDVLFYESIGRTDLPGGDYDTLIKSIKSRIMLLPDETIVHSGHGPATTIGHERKYNPFLH